MMGLPQLSIWLVGLSVFLAAWFFGGWGPVVMPVAAGICLLAFGLGLTIRPGVRRAPWMGFKLVVFLPWLFFLVLGATGILNPAYEAVALPDGRVLSLIPFRTYLPTVINPGHALLVLIMVAGQMGVVLVVLRSSFSRSRLRQVLGFLVMNAAALSLVGLAGKLAPGFDLFHLLPATDTLPFSTFDYHNNWTGFAIPALALAIGLIEYGATRLDADGSPRRPPGWLIVSSGLLVGGVVLSSSRSGPILMTVLAMAVLYRLADRIRRRGIRGATSGRSFRPVLLYLMISVVVLGGLLFAGRDIMKARWDYTQMQVEQIAGGHRLEPRLFLARDTARMAMSRPMLGWGNGSWAYLFPLFAGPEFSVERGSDMRQFPFAHNDWLQLLAENGFLGTLALVSVPVWLILGLRSRGRANPISFWAFLGVALTGLLACWDYPMGHPANQLQVALLFAIGVAYAVLEKQVERISDEG